MCGRRRIHLARRRDLSFPAAGRSVKTPGSPNVRHQLGGRRVGARAGRSARNGAATRWNRTKRAENGASRRPTGAPRANDGDAPSNALWTGEFARSAWRPGSLTMVTVMASRQRNHLGRARAHGEIQGSAGDVTRDDVLNDITLYWLTNTAISAARFYWELHFSLYNAANVSIPVAMGVFPRRELSSPAELDRGSVSQAHLFQRGRQGRSLCGLGTAGTLFRQAPSRIRVAAQVLERVVPPQRPRHFPTPKERAHD